MSANDLDFDEKGFGFGSQFSSPLSAKGSSVGASPETKAAAVGVVVLEEASGPGGANAAASNESVVDDQVLRPRTASGRSWRAMSNNYRYSFSTSRARDEHGHPLVVTKGIGSSVSLAGSVHSESTTEDPEETQGAADVVEEQQQQQRAQTPPAIGEPAPAPPNDRQPNPTPPPAAAAAAAPQAGAERQEMAAHDHQEDDIDAESPQTHPGECDATEGTASAHGDAPAGQGSNALWDVIYDEEDFGPPTGASETHTDQATHLSVAATTRQHSPSPSAARSPRALSPAAPTHLGALQDRLSPIPSAGHHSPRPRSPASRSPVPPGSPGHHSPAAPAHQDLTSPPASPGPFARMPPSPVRLSPVPRSPVPPSPVPHSPVPLRAASPAATAPRSPVPIAASALEPTAAEPRKDAEKPAGPSAAASEPVAGQGTDAQPQGIASRQLSSTSVDGTSPDRGASSRTSIDSTTFEERIADVDSPAVAAALRSRSKVSRSVAERVALLLPTAKSEPNVMEPGRHRLSLSDSIGSIQARLKQLHGPKTLAMKLSEVRARLCVFFCLFLCVKGAGVLRAGRTLGYLPGHLLACRGQPRRCFLSRSSGSHSIAQAEAAAGEEHGGKLVVYTTTMRAIKATANACDSVRRMLQMHRVIFEERDVFMSAQFAEELSERCPNLRAPQIFFNGNHIGVSRYGRGSCLSGCI
jgi:glutaredoxin